MIFLMRVKNEDMIRWLRRWGVSLECAHYREFRCRTAAAALQPWPYPPPHEPCAALGSCSMR